jgi:serine/threonine-protein kinase
MAQRREQLKHPGSLGRYTIQDELGRGMMGVVYRARDPELARSVALKVIQLPGALTAQEKRGYEQRFLAEARAAAALAHPGVVVVHDIGRDPDAGTFYIAFELLEGKTLAEMIAGGRRVEWRRMLRLACRIADALHHAHGRGIVHRDVKPANIMVLPTGEPKIMDFGIAKLPTSELTGAGELFGTPLYMSPEQAAGLTVDGRSDLFALGAILYRSLTGEHAFGADSSLAVMKRLTTTDAPAPSSYYAGLPPAVDEVVLRAMARTPADRYPNGQAMAEALEAVLEDERKRPPLRSGPRPTPQPAPNRRGVGETLDLSHAPRPALSIPSGPRVEPAAKRRPGLIGGGLGAAALVAAMLAWGGSQGESTPTAGGTGAPAGVPDPAAVEPRAERPLPPTGQLEIGLRHSLRDGGELKVWAGERLVLETPLQASSRQVRESHALGLPAGEQVLRVEVRSAGRSWINRTQGSFRPGQPRLLEAVMSGMPGDRSAGLVLMPLQ